MNVNKQRGSTAIGVILGVLIGLGVALGVAVYVMKVPTPFNSKSTSRTPAQDAAEAKKNKDWDPNAALSGKPVAKPTDPAATKAPEPTAKPQAAPATASQTPAAASPSPASPTADAAIEYYVQVGAFRSEGDAQALRGKLALSNFEGKVVEREQSGQKVYRVRVGPFANQAAGDKAKASLDASGFDTMVIRAQR
jgi:cell division protein FtsN